MKWRREWSGLADTEDAWKLELDCDRMAGDRPVAVTIYVENGDPNNGGECGLAELSPEDARSLADSLMQEADNVEHNNGGFRA